ncbi:MAG TPA: c-type cytochrome [Steroidobacteraceae bacterium]
MTPRVRGARGVASRALACVVQAVVSLAAAPLARAADAPSPAYPVGFASFQANCSVCHGPTGAGVPALAPPLLSYPARYAASAEGRRQLALTVLYGMIGDITVDDKHYNFQMPDFARLDDATLAATLNFVVFDLGHAPAELKPLTAQEIAVERVHVLDGAAVREHRKSVVPAGP